MVLADDLSLAPGVLEQRRLLIMEDGAAHMLSVVAIRLIAPLAVQEPFHTVVRSNGALSVSVKIRNPCNSADLVVLEKGDVIGFANIVSKPKGVKIDAPTSTETSHSQKAENKDNVYFGSSPQQNAEPSPQESYFEPKTKPCQQIENNQEVKLCACKKVEPGERCPNCPVYNLVMRKSLRHKVRASRIGDPVVLELVVAHDSSSTLLDFEGLDGERILANPLSYRDFLHGPDVHLLPGCLWRLEGGGENRLFAVAQCRPIIRTIKLFVDLEEGEVVAKCQLVEGSLRAGISFSSEVLLEATTKSKEDVVMHGLKSHGTLGLRYPWQQSMMRPSDLVHVHIPLSDPNTLFSYTNCFRVTEAFSSKRMMSVMVGLLKQNVAVRDAKSCGKTMVVRTSGF